METMETGDGWHRIDLEEWGRATQYQHYDIYSNGEVLYEEDHPYAGDYMSKTEALRVIDAFPEVYHIRWVYEYRDDPSDTDFAIASELVNIDPDLRFTILIMEMPGWEDLEGELTVFVHRLQDDWYIVDFRHGEFDFEERPMFKCDQIGGIVRLVKHLWRR